MKTIKKRAIYFIIIISNDLRNAVLLCERKDNELSINDLRIVAMLEVWSQIIAHRPGSAAAVGC
ncbi:hypothetical protein SAMN03097699_1879 [Flavobacteriaceae bacterium MAR_2010_188]|nr:hypothetical protein SAMN03097699_1879 [Flavobacteriaceae bacterium MAR_2010_188]